MDNQVIRVVESLAFNIGTPRALAVLLLVRAGEWAELQQLRVEPKNYGDSESYWKDCMITDLLRKCDLPSTIDREAAAVATFELCEHQCATTNSRLRRYLPEHLFIEEPDLPVYDFINRWRKNVIKLMGNLPDSLLPRFSGGATYADTGLLKTIPDKMSSTPTIYSATTCLLPLWGETSWARSLVKTRPWQSRPRQVRGNIFFTVPKDGTKFRGCAKEASIAVTYQLDVGRLLKDRLLTIGIDLLRGQPMHQAAAKLASADGSLATIDMSNASDTVSRVLVQLLVRGDWHELLCSLRATHTRVNGRWHRLEKFSSMGNGFTFELETVIFATLARTVIADEGGDPDSVMCYGDDLIVPTQYYKSVIAGLRLFGFTPNSRKTFAEGPFRESCGGDFWDGKPVRAHYLENLPDEPQHWISLANGLRRVALADDRCLHRWDIVRTAWLRCLDPIPSHIRRCRGPESLGDVVIHDAEEFWAWADPPNTRHQVSFVERDAGPSQDGLPRQRTYTLNDGSKDGWEQGWIHAYVPVPSVLPWHHWYPEVQLASCTLGLPAAGVTPRDGVDGYRIGRVPARVTSSWLPTPMG
jgi:hypothetical protein